MQATRILSSVLLLAALGACPNTWNLTFEEGLGLPCEDDQACPEGLVCSADMTCQSVEGMDAAATDAGRQDIGPWDSASSDSITADDGAAADSTTADSSSTDAGAADSSQADVTLQPDVALLEASFPDGSEHDAAVADGSAADSALGDSGGADGSAADSALGDAGAADGSATDSSDGDAGTGFQLGGSASGVEGADINLLEQVSGAGILVGEGNFVWDVTFEPGDIYDVAPVQPTDTTRHCWVENGQGVFQTGSELDLLLFCRPAFRVYDLSDLPDDTPGDGACAASSGACTLRAAIQESNAGMSGNPQGFAIVVPADIFVITPAALPPEDLPSEGDLDIYGNVQIFADGLDNSFTVDGDNVTCLFDVHEQSLLGLHGAVLENATQETTGCAVNVRMQATAALDLVEVRHNGSAQQAGAVVNNSGVLRVSRSYFHDNIADNGGAIRNRNGQLTMSQSLFASNTARHSGGAIHSMEVGAGYSRVAVTNSTFSGNTCRLDPSEGEGCAISTAGEAETWLNNVTVVDNRANQPLIESAGLFAASSSLVHMLNTVVAGNTDAAEEAADCTGTFASTGGNLIGEQGLSCNVVQHPSDIIGSIVSPQDPALGPLQDNGGYNMCHLPEPASIVIGNANFGACPPLDQRGEPRLLDGECDRGAVERN